MAKKTKMIFGDEAKKALQAGINAVAKAVAVTMGPGGRLVVLPGMYGQRVITRDGVTVAKSIFLEDQFENEAAQLVKQVAARTNDSAGDGTSTSIVLAQALVSEGLKYVATGGNPVAVKKGMELAVDKVVEYILNNKQAVSHKDSDMIEFVATISGSDAEVGKLVAEAFTAVGENGVVTFEEGKTSKTVLDVTEGLTFDRGYISPYFAPANKSKVEYEHCKILVWEGRIATAGEIIPTLEAAAGKNQPILIICDDMDGEALATAVINTANNRVQAVAVKAPGFGERKKGFMQDIAIATGAKYFTEDLKYKIENVKFSDFGEARKVIVDSESTTIVDAQGDPTKLEEHLANLRQMLAESDSKYDSEKLTERIAKLSSGIAIIKIGAGTEAELGEKKFRFEDAISATKAALELGIVPGAGNTLVGASLELSKKSSRKDLSPDVLAGYDIVAKALMAPLKTIAENAGYNGQTILDKVLQSMASHKGSIMNGFDSREGQWVDLIKAGIIDPAKVTKSAIENAASIAILVLTTETLIVDASDKEPQGAGY